MTTYKQNSATINVDTCAVSAETRVIGLGSLLRSPEWIMLSGVACGVFQRILKMSQEESFEKVSLFAVLAKEMRIAATLFHQGKTTSVTRLRTVQSFLKNLTASPVQTQCIFAKSVSDPFSGPNSHVHTSTAMQAMKLAVAV